MTICLDLAPTFEYHILEGNFPPIYKVFWIVGGICFLITWIITLPHWLSIRKEGLRIRDESGEIIMPLPFVIVLIIVGFPLLLSFCALLTLIIPLSDYLNEFLMNIYDGLCLFAFGRLLIMYLGSFKAIMNAFKSDAANTNNNNKVNYWASPPIACCFRFCLKPKVMTEKDLRQIYFLIIQYAIFPPILIFIILLHASAGVYNTTYEIVLNINKILAILCIYGLFVLMTASKNILHEYSIHGKFYTIKTAVACMLIPSIIFGTFFTINEYNGDPDNLYSSEVMTKAWCYFSTTILVMFASIMFRRNFTIKDCINAYKNDSNQSWVRQSIQPLVTNDHLSMNNVDNNNDNDDNNSNSYANKENNLDP